MGNDVRIRPAASNADLRICRMLLPAISAHSPSPYYMVASESDRIVAAIGAVQNTDTGVLVLRVDIQVIPPSRRRGIARMLIAALSDVATASGVTALDAFTIADANSDTETFWNRLGFSAFKTIYEFEAEVMDVHESTLPLLTRIREKGRIPSNARLVPIAEVPRDQLVALHSAHLGGSAEAIMPLVSGERIDGFDQQISLALMLGDQLAGVALCRQTTDPEVWREDSFIIAPSMRNSYAMLWIINEQALRGYKVGVRRFRFTTFEMKNGARLVGPTVPLTVVSERRWMRQILATHSAV